MENLGLVNYGNSNLLIRVSPTLLAIEEMLSEHSTNKQQEPKITAYISQDENMIEAFRNDKDIYATIASIAFNVPYEQCLEFHPETGEYQPDGKARRGEAKTVVLGILYGRSTITIGEQLYGKEPGLSVEDRTKKAQKVYDEVLLAFPKLRNFMLESQKNAAKYGFVETILGRRRHIPDMQLPEFEFKAMKGYINPDVDPMDISTLEIQEEIPKRIVDELKREFASYKYFGQIMKRTKELYEQKIKVINNRSKITEASRQCVNSRVQGSAADMTKRAMLALEHNEEWNKIGGRLLVPVHDELICEVPIEYYQEGADILSGVMCEAGSFLPFPIKCDVEISYRWYGLSYPCPYPQPNSLDNMTEDEIKWIQYHLFEMEYQLPVYLDEDGEKPRGDAAKGVNGVASEEMEAAIGDYMKKYRVLRENFIEHIHHKVHTGE